MVSGYRQHSFDSNAFEQPGPPARPFNWVQWIGAIFAVVGIGMFFAYAAGRLGWIPQLLPGPTLGTSLTLVGIVLINSRTQPVHDPAPELAAARERWLVIVTIICVAVLGGAAALEITGAD